MHLIKVNFIYILFLFLIFVLIIILNLLLSFIRFEVSRDLGGGRVEIGGRVGVGVWRGWLGCGW